jgi:hypothetical protein
MYNQLNNDVLITGWRVLMKFLKQILAAGFALAIAHSASASIISVNGTEVEALDLNGSYSSFLDFYDYNTVNRFTSNTGLEQSDSIVMFFAELNSELSLFTLVSGPLGGNGKASVSFSGSDGAISFVDDAAEFTSTSSVNWEYSSKKGDGLIYSGITDALWSLDFDFTGLENVKGLEFLSFTDGLFDNATAAISGNDTTYSVLGISNSSVQVSEPTSLAMFGALLLGLSLTRRKA